MPYILDADWIIQALAGHRRAISVLDNLMPEGIFVSFITVAEVYEEAFRSTNPEGHLDRFRRFLSPYQRVGLDEPTVELFAEIRAWLRRRGELIPDLDIMVGATAVHHGLTLLTFNVRHLRRIPDLQIYSPQS